MRLSFQINTRKQMRIITTQRYVTHILVASPLFNNQTIVLSYLVSYNDTRSNQMEGVQDTVSTLEDPSRRDPPSSNKNKSSSNKNKPRPSSSKKKTSSSKKKKKKKPPPAGSNELKRKPSALEAEKKIVEEELAPVVEAKDDFLANEKSLVPLLDSPNPLFFGHPSCSPYWRWILHVDWPVFEQYLIDNSDDIPQTPGILKLINNMKTKTKIGDMKNLKSALTPQAKNKAMKEKYSNLVRYVVICPRCFANKDKPLDECILLCGLNKTSNIATHIGKYHKDVQIQDDADDPSPMKSQGTLSSMIIKDASKSTASAELRQLMYRFINDCALPAITAEKKEFRDLIRYAINNSAALRDTPAEIMSRREISKLRISSYESFFGVATNLINACRSEYERLCYQKVPFISVCHDIWQARDHDVLGVTIMFIDPRNCEVYRIPIGLAECKGHAATDVANLTDVLLLGVGITTGDLSASVNDNTTAAVLAGKYIVGQKDKTGKCDMHKAELVLKHATGLVQRYHNRQLMDSNTEFLELWQIFKQFASWLTSKKSPKRMRKFREACIAMGMKIVSIPLPNDTRVAGLILTIQALLRCKFVMDAYSTLTGFRSDPKFKKLYPEEKEWKLLAQYEGILAPLKQVSMSLQSDEPGASSAALLEIYCAYFQATTMRSDSKEYGGVSCLNVSSGAETQWDARDTMDDLDRLRDPILYKDLEAGPRHLIRRIIAEYKHYLFHRDEDGIKAVCANPLLGNVYENMFVNFGVFDQDTVKECRRIIIKDMVAKFSNKSVSQIGLALSKQGATGREGDDIENVEEQAMSPSRKTIRHKTRDVFANMRRSHDLQQQALLHLSGKASNAASENEMVMALQKACTSCYDEFCEHCKGHIDNHWDQMMEDYGTPAFYKARDRWNDNQKREFAMNCKN